MTDVHKRIPGGSRTAVDRLYMIRFVGIDPSRSTIANQGRPIKIRPDFQKPMTESDQESNPADSPPNASSLEQRVQQVLELIRPAVQEDGGDIKLVAVETDGTVKIRFLGACIGCPSSEITLRDGIARNLRERVPEVTAVVAVD